MKKSIIVLLHIGFWLCYLLLIAIMVGVFYRSSGHSVDQTARVLNAFRSIFTFALFPSVITFYLYYFLIFQRHLKQNKIFLSIISGLLISLGAAVLGYILIRYQIETGQMVDMDEGGKHGRSTAIRTIIVMTIIASISGMVALVIKGFITWFDELKLKEELKQKNHDTEMALVKAQLDPHFLFNTLNNIDTLILNNAKEASNYLNMLSDILRFMLYETKTDRILLEHEIEYIKKYIELQKIRTSNLNYVHFQVTGSPGNKTIAPLIFIPFIENAFKHGDFKDPEFPLIINLLNFNNELSFMVENKKGLYQKDKLHGIGIANLKRRLALIYPDRHFFDIEESERSYKATLTIKW